MPRRKPFSAKQKKQQLQDKRAVKRGDLDPADNRIPSSRTRPGHGFKPARGQGNTSTTATGADSGGKPISARLQSKFIALTPEYLVATRDYAYSHRLARPIPDDAAVFSDDIMRRDGGALTCPTRPKFRYDMSKKEVERNEEGVFNKWLRETEAVVKAYVAGEGGAGERGEEGVNDGGDVGREKGVVGSGAKAGNGVEANAVDGTSEDDATPAIRSPTWFETNLEVYRQLWRVTESSDILLLLADARCPPVHLPHSLRHYVQTHAQGRTQQHRKEVVVVLTKTDLCDPGAVEGWVEWVRAWWRDGLRALRVAKRQRSQRGPSRAAAASETAAGDVGEAEARHEVEQELGNDQDVDVVCVHSYDVELLYSSSRHRPDLPSAALQQLTDALRRAHARLSAPPPHMDEHKRARWVPSVRTEVDWDLLALGPAAAYPPAGEREAEGDEALGSDGDDGEEESESDVASRAASVDGDGKVLQVPAGLVNNDTGDADHNPPSIHPAKPHAQPLTIGLIGQPNVGKSSLLNALMGESRVRASKTPGKTLFWGWKRHVKIVDCPGLVCPSLVGLEIQALCGVLPISQIPSLPACLTTAAALLPLETVFRITPPAASPVDAHADKRTWRHPRPEAEAGGAAGAGVAPKDGPQGAGAETSGYRWTAGELIEARALDRGYGELGSKGQMGRRDEGDGQWAMGHGYFGLSSFAVTAKSGRPDGNRAANAMLRSLAEGKVRWGFSPPSGPASTLAHSSSGAATSSASTPAAGTGTLPLASRSNPSFDRAGRGIWLGEYVNDPEDGAEDDEADASEEEGAGDEVAEPHRGDADSERGAVAESDSDSSDDGDVSEVEGRARRIDQGFFAALDLDEGGGIDDDQGDDDDFDVGNE